MKNVLTSYLSNTHFMFVFIYQIIESIPQHMFQSSHDHLQEEDKTFFFPLDD